jgi:orotidine-5'-phosphate decarboxylase
MDTTSTRQGMNFRPDHRAQPLNDSMLCVGLDPEPAKFPLAWRGDAARIFDFCAAIVDATHDLVIAFKPQIAYFAAQRAEDQLERLIAHIHRVAPQVPVILDAKRGDIGATAEQYAREAFERYRADALTLSPFMGYDSIEPYMRYDGKGLILLCRTSNPGGSDLQAQPLPVAACCTNTSRAWPPGPGTATASSAWWWAPPTRRKWRACVNWRPRCRC